MASWPLVWPMSFSSSYRPHIQGSQQATLSRFANGEQPGVEDVFIVSVTEGQRATYGPIGLSTAYFYYLEGCISQGIFSRHMLDECTLLW